MWYDIGTDCVHLASNIAPSRINFLHYYPNVAYALRP